MATQILCAKKRGRVDSVDSDRDSAEVKRLRDDLLGLLDDSELADESTQELDSFMKSFQEEISSAAASPAKVVDLTSESGESQPDLGYLLEASDDDLGIPRLGDSDELVRAESDSSGFGGFWGLEEEQGLGFGVGEEFPNGDEFVGYDGLFGFSDVYFDSSDNSDMSWRSETMPAL